ncbi:uncharacterized protein LOC105213129 [Zeugodacus cucurbitae]|uniref:Glutamate synthase [NADPH] large chain n=1 Tax=Zeugodacus cucurbitae TaxID=28588 RepID=A0A0A1XCU0_ZEUCU|nr:uncharacterized protein LOC105213129 [Zeugodacus cucurbitae]
MYKFLQYAAIVSLFCLFGSNVVVAQNAPPSLTQCLNASSLTNLTSAFEGQWYEALRSPASQSSCVGLDIYSNATGIYLNLTTPEDSHALYLNQTSTYTLTPVGEANSSISANVTSPAGGYSYPTGNNVNVTIKILQTDSANYAVLCGISSKSNSSFGLVLTRQRVVTNASLASYVGQVNSTYAGFANLSTVNQGPVCYQNSAATHASALSLVFAVIYAAIKFTN